MADIPKIRFKGFTEPWEQRKLGEMGSTFTGLSGKTKEDFGHGDAKFITYMNVFSNPIANLDMTEYVEIDSKQNCVKAGDVFFTTSSETPEEVGMSCVMPENADNIYLNSFCFGYRPTVEFDLNYLAYVLRAESFRKNMTFLAQGISRYNISKNKVMEIKISVPSLDEQNLVGAYFSNLDHLITLHQRKCDDTKELKKYMLQKMFPKNGEKFPEIRFKGFTEAWEQRKLGEICSRVQGNDGRMELPTLTISAANGWMKQEDRFSGNIAGKEQKNYTLLHKGELSYNHGNSKLAKYGTVFSLQTYEEALVPRVYHSFKVEIGSADFIEYYFATKMPDRELRKLISSGARMDGLLNIGYDDFMGIKMMFPSVLEQDKIAEYFRAFDHLITLHQRKCDTLKELKKYMLQNMFPKKG